ncbi:MAG: FHA domain-containing protein, partial [Planctomycetota bacterium]|nr:FHA domain-containing protein [Planctomycetota bacterium]
MPQIRVKNGKQKGKVISLEGTSRLVIGRDVSCGLQIMDQGVSREHSEIYRVGEMIFIRDLDSRNGSFVNGERVKEELLREGDLIRVGNVHLVFESSHKTREQDLQFDDGEPFKTSLELKLDDLYEVDVGMSGRESELFRAICQATQIVQSERDEKKLFERLLDLIQEHIPADHLFVFLRDETTGSVTPRAARAKAPKGSVPISRSILRRVISESRAILTADAMQDDRFKADDSILMHQIRAVLCVPIQSGGGEALGAIYAVNSSLTETFVQSDLQLLTAMGAQLAMSLENLHSSRNRRRMFLRAIGRIVSILEGAAIGARGHAERVSEFATAIARELGLPDREVLCASMAGLLHDIGKIPLISGLSAADAERSSGAAHVLGAMELLKNIPGMDDVLTAIMGHHEHFDGTGVPRQLAGDAIPLCARIVAVASDFDKLLYPAAGESPAGEPDAARVKKAFTDLDQRAGTVYDPSVVRALIVSYRHGTLRSEGPPDGIKAAAATGSASPAANS